jgi:NAD(P)-dependent dehydrogenase (short-subunit alcohol dehydrogenase family)
MSETHWTTAAIPAQTGKTILITGANSGIGYQAALELARAGAHVILAVRNREKGEKAMAQLKRSMPSASLELADLDVSLISSVRAFAEPFVASGRTLDVLINNAGVMAMPTRELTAEGHERQMATNHFGHFALTGLLLPALLKSEWPRVVSVSSLAHRSGKIELDNLDSEKHYSPMGTYGNTKLANLLFAKELDRRSHQAGSHLRSVAVHPGVARTPLFSNGVGQSKLKSIVFNAASPIFFQSDEAGAWPLEFAATMPELKGGEYVGPDGFMGLKGFPKVVEPKPNALDEKAARELWDASERITGVSY